MSVFIEEKVIEEIAEKLGASPDLFATAIESVKDQQPAILGYLFSESFEALTNQERDYMLYLAVVVIQSIAEKSDSELMEVDAIGEMEETNWTIANQHTSGTFRDQLNPFFENYKQEDLLAFVEDALIDEEEGLLTKEGRMPIFITLKTIIDLLT